MFSSSTFMVLFLNLDLCFMWNAFWFKANEKGSVVEFAGVVTLHLFLWLLIVFFSHWTVSSMKAMDGVIFPPCSYFQCWAQCLPHAMPSVYYLFLQMSSLLYPHSILNNYFLLDFKMQLYYKISRCLCTFPSSFNSLIVLSLLALILCNFNCYSFLLLKTYLEGQPQTFLNIPVWEALWSPLVKLFASP